LLEGLADGKCIGGLVGTKLDLPVGDDAICIIVGLTDGFFDGIAVEGTEESLLEGSMLGP
jgi:hypothetical protein